MLLFLPCLLSRPAGGQERSALSLDRERFVEGLLAKMTLEEKIGQLNQVSLGPSTGPGVELDSAGELVASGQIGSFLNVASRERANALQRIAVESSRLHTPLLFGLDVIHGFRTIFPIPLAVSATWDLALVEDLARLAAREAAAQGIRWTFSPMVDIARDGRWGRIAESAGEDPFLGAAMASAYVRGYQGRSLDDATSILACVKHFVGYGAAEAGRDYNTTEISERTLRQIYLPPFHAAVDAGALSVMSGFNALDGVPASSNAFTIRQVLETEWGFRGFVVSDWGAVRELMAHGIANTEATAARKAMLAGVDVDMQDGLYARELAKLVKTGAVPLATVDAAVRRVLRVKAALGLFERPYGQPGANEEGELSPFSRRLARVAAEESFVLLKNQSVRGLPLLPLTRKPGRNVALLGPLADSALDMLGSWVAQGRPKDVVTLKTSMAERAVREKMVFHYAKGSDILGGDRSGFRQALAVARRADVVIVALGEKGDRTGEAASRAHLDFEDHQQQLLEAVVATGKPVVLLLFNGRPLTLPWAAEHVPAVLEAWFPGVEAGPALVRTLFGDANPAGRLTVTFPRTVGQEPMYYNALNTGRPASTALHVAGGNGETVNRFVSRYIDEPNEPLYSFGYGLSYTTFAFGPVSTSTRTVSAAALSQGQASLRVRASVTNLGTRGGTVVAQCYIRLTGTSVSRPVRELRGFSRIELGPGESRQVEFVLGRRELAYWNLDMHNIVEPSLLTVWIAGDPTGGIPASVEIAD